MTVREVGRYVNMSTTGRRLPASVWSEDGQQRASGPSLTSSSRQNLPLRLVQQSLMILIQHHCVLHSSQVHGGADLAQSSQEEYFEANVDEILARLRFGTYLTLAHEWGGDEAEAAIRLLLYHGQMRAGDLMDELSESGGRANGIASGRESAAGRIGQLLVKMLQDSFVRPSTAVQHVSRQDRHITHENALRRSFKGVPTAKTLKEIKVRVAAVIDEEDRKEWEAQGNSLDEPRLGLKRKADAGALARDKRAKKHGGSDVAAVRREAEGESAALEIDRDVWLRVHYDRFNVRIRNNMLVNAVAQKYNATTGDIFRAMLQGDGPGPVRCEMDERSRPIALSTLVHALPHGLKIQRGLDKRSILGEESSKSAHPTTTELLAEYVAILTNHDNISSSVRTTRFLAPFGNATTTSAGGTAKVPTSFTVEYVNMVHQLQLQMIRDVVVERFGPMAGRIFSILVEKGKLEEKHVRRPTHPDFENRPDLDGRNARCLLAALCRVAAEPARSAKKQRAQPPADILLVVCRRAQVQGMAARPLLPDAHPAQPAAAV